MMPKILTINLLQRELTEEHQHSPCSAQRDLMKQNITDIMKNKTCTDVIIECDGKEFPVHKFILIIASDYFRRIFENDSCGSSNNRISYPNINNNVMKLVIDFIYLLKPPLPIDQETVIDTFKVAHLFELKPLVDYCSLKLIDSLTIDNFLVVWHLTEEYNNEFMNAQINSFLQNNLEAIMKAKQVLLLSLENLKVLIEKINGSEKKATDYMIKSILDWVKQHQEDRKEYLLELFASFKEFDLSSGFLSFLIHNEPLITENNEILLLYLKNQLKKEKSNETVVCRQLIHNPSKTPLSILHSSLRDYVISSTIQLPFKVTSGMSFISNNNYIYFIGGDKEIENSDDPPQCNDYYERGSTSVIRYNVNTFTHDETVPLLFPVYNASVFIDNNTLHVLGRNSMDVNSAVVYVQICELSHILENECWSAYEALNDFNDVKFFCNINNSIFYIGKQL